MKQGRVPAGNPEIHPPFFSTDISTRRPAEAATVARLDDAKTHQDAARESGSS